MFKNVTTVENHIEEMHTRNPFKKETKFLNIADVFGDNKN